MQSPIQTSVQFPGPVDCEATASKVGLCGESYAHTEVVRELAAVAPTDIEVLIQGETGTGKELYARFVHEGSGCSGPFVPVNCGALPDALFESEIFGHAAGAFTGATIRSDGLVTTAEHGTLFLDEVHALSPAAQVKLLRLLQEKEYRRVGDTRIRIADVRFIAATNQDLQELVKEKQFREDLFYRLSVLCVHIAPLRARPEDIDPILALFNKRYCERYKAGPIEVSASARDLLRRHDWPGNLRELENCIRRMICRHPSGIIEADDLSLSDHQSGDEDAMEPTPTSDFSDLPFQEAKRVAVDRFERTYISTALQRTRGNIAQAARLSNKHRRAFFELMRKHGILADEFRSTSKPR